MNLNWRVILNVLGLLLLFNGAFMLLCLPASLVYNPKDLVPILFAACATIGVGMMTWVLTRKDKPNIKKRDGYLIVTLGWLIMSVSGSLPYIMSGTVINFTDAFFETLSGYTTTGASVITDLSLVPKDILLWRSLTQWIGGMGIIVLAVAILPVLGIGGMQLFSAEAPGFETDKIAPRISATAKRLWYIYVGLTILEFILLKIAGMTWFDSINHALTTMATGGFSTHNESMAFYADRPVVQYIVIVFMFLAGTNCTLNYLAATGKPLRPFKNEEFRFYLGLVVIVTVLVAIGVAQASSGSMEETFRDSLFQVVSVVTTTGFVSADYTGWTPSITMIFFVLMFIGGSAGSTSGGVKIVRHIVLAKNSLLELKRQLHPNAVIPVRLNKKAIEPRITYNVVAFIMMYITVFAVGCFVMALIGLDFDTALGAVATSLGNIGPGIGDVGPMDNFSSLPSLAKWVLAILMLVGRLELFTVLILFSPYFWSRRG